MAQRRSKISGRDAPKKRRSLGVLLGICIGLGLAIAVMFYVNRASQEIGDNHDLVDSVLNSGNPQATEEDVEFDFYKLLPGGDEVSESSGRVDENISASARAVYFIQVAALSNAREADNLKARLAMNGFESRIQSIETAEGRLLHRIRVGPYSDLAALEDIKAEMAEFNFDVTVVRVQDNN